MKKKYYWLVVKETGAIHLTSGLKLRHRCSRIKRFEKEQCLKRKLVFIHGSTRK